MNSSFLEWIQQRTQIEESTGRLRRMQMSDYTPDIDPTSGVTYWVINNAGQFLNDVLKMPTAQQLEQGIGPQLRDILPELRKYSLFKISGVEGKTVKMTRSTKETYSTGKEKLANIASLRDVTDSFKSMGIGKADVNNRYYINISGSRMEPSKIDKMVKAYMNLTRAQAGGGSHEDRQDLAVRNFIGGDQAVKDRLNQGASDMRDQMWADISLKISAGQNVNQQLKSLLYDDEKGTFLLNNPRFVKKLQINGWDNIIHYAKWSGIAGPLSPEEQTLVKNLQEFNNHIKAGIHQTHPEVFENNPMVDMLLKNPNTPYIVQAFNLQGVADYMQEKGANDTFQQRMLQQQQMQQPKPQGDDLFARIRAMQTQGETEASPGATAFDNMFRKAESYSRHWKTDPRSVYLTEGRRFYGYYPER